MGSQFLGLKVDEPTPIQHNINFKQEQWYEENFYVYVFDLCCAGNAIAG